MVGLAVVAVLSINYIPVLKVFPETIQVILLQDMKLGLIMLIFIIVSVIGAYMGLESISTINYLFLPIVGIMMFAFLLLLIPYYDLNNLTPVFGNGFKSLFFNGTNSLSIFSDIILLNILLPYMENYGEFRKNGFRAITIGGIVVVLIMFAYCLVYPYPESENFILPVYQLTRVIHLSSFFSRFETFFQFAWTILMLLYSSFYLYIISYVWQTTFNLKDNKPLLIPIVMCIFGIAANQGSVMDFIDNEEFFNYIVYPFSFLLPLLFGLCLRKVEKHEET